MPEQVLRAFLDEALSRSPHVGRLVVGFSGGVDSTVLLYLLRKMQAEHGRELLAVHVHHGLSPDADAWLKHAASVCSTWQVPFDARRVQVRPTGSVEAAARHARREALASFLQEGDALLLAHHQDDQAETLLFRLVRGAGVTGLGAMREMTVIKAAGGDASPLWRPFLGVSRASLVQIARRHGLAWIEDESNADTRFSRNFLRQEVLPLMQRQWPAVVATLSATARRMREADQLLQELAGELATSCIDERQRLCIPAVQRFSSARKALVLRYWLAQQGFPLPDEGVLAQMISAVMESRDDAQPRLTWPGCEIRRYRQHLYAMPPVPEVPQGWEVEWEMTAPLLLPDGRCLYVSAPGAMRLPVRVRFRRGGERLRAQGVTHDLKKLLQSSSVPPWERSRLPLLFCNEALVAVAGTSLRSPDWPGDIQLKLEPAIGSRQ